MEARFKELMQSTEHSVVEALPNFLKVASDIQKKPPITVNFGTNYCFVPAVNL